MWLIDTLQEGRAGVLCAATFRVPSTSQRAQLPRTTCAPSCWCTLVGFLVQLSLGQDLPCRHQGGSTGGGGGDQYASEVCEAFCSDQCSFFNRSAGEAGLPTNLTLYRMTPTNVTDAANKDLADIPGDLGFFLSRKTLRLRCALDPRDQRCFLAHNNSYASFEIEVDGRFGPYLMCNPATRSWGYDTSEFLCSLSCMTPPQCGTYHRNGTTFHGDYQCYCARTNRTVGRQPRGGDWTPNAAATGASLPSQCENFDVVWPPGPGQCLAGQELRRVHSLRGAPSVDELLCQACNAASACVAWTRLNATDGITLGSVDVSGGALSLGFGSGPSPTCISARRKNSRGGVDAGTEALFYGIGAKFGGYWFSLPAEGECARSRKGNQSVGTGQLGVTCSWRLVVAGKRVSAACLEGHLDRVVEQWNAPCFDKLGPLPPAPSLSDIAATSLNHTKNTLEMFSLQAALDYTEAYLDCYLSALLGDPAHGIAPLQTDSLVAAWRRAFATTARSAGGCEPV